MPRGRTRTRIPTPCYGCGKDSRRKGDYCVKCMGVRNADNRFWVKVNKSTLSGCWEWMAAKNRDGYGEFWMQGKLVRANRYSYERHIGPLKPGELALHRCDNPSCVNPEHLFAGSDKDNMQDMLKKDRKRGIKLKVDQVREIKRRLRGGEDYESLAKAYNVHPSSIYVIDSGKTWAAIEA